MANPHMGPTAGVYKVLRGRHGFADGSNRFPEQRITRQEALRGKGWHPVQCHFHINVVIGMTIDPAYSSFTENILGSLEVGKRADYVVLSQNIMTIPENEILATLVLTTAIDGVPIYGDI